MVIEDFSPELIYIEGAKNIVADAFSRLELKHNPQKILKQEKNDDIYFT